MCLSNPAWVAMKKPSRPKKTWEEVVRNDLVKVNAQNHSEWWGCLPECPTLGSGLILIALEMVIMRTGLLNSTMVIPLGLHYNHYVSPHVWPLAVSENVHNSWTTRYILIKFCIHMHVNIYSLNTGIRNHLFDGRMFAEHQCRPLAVSKMFIALEPHRLNFAYTICMSTFLNQWLP